MVVLCHRSISPTPFSSCAPWARAPSSFVRTLDSGATVRSPNCDLRGSSVTCASHGGTAKRLARMLQRSLDPACNGFVTGLASPSSNTVDTVTVRYLLTDGTVITGWRYGWAMLAPDWLPQPGPSEQWTSQGGGRTSREQSREEPALFSSSRRTHRLIFLAAIAPGPGPFRSASSSCAEHNPAKRSSAASLLTADVAHPLAKGLPQPKKRNENKESNKEKTPRKKNRVYGLPSQIQTVQTLLRPKRGRANRAHQQTSSADPLHRRASVGRWITLPFWGCA